MGEGRGQDHNSQQPLRAISWEGGAGGGGLLFNCLPERRSRDLGGLHGAGCAPCAGPGGGLLLRCPGRAVGSGAAASFPPRGERGGRRDGLPVRAGVSGGRGAAAGEPGAVLRQPGQLARARTAAGAPAAPRRHLAGPGRHVRGDGERACPSSGWVGKGGSP